MLRYGLRHLQTLLCHVLLICSVITLVLLPDVLRDWCHHKGSTGAIILLDRLSRSDVMVWVVDAVESVN
jgi:hypothetical protein